MAVISAPEKWVESVSHLRLSPSANERLQRLMDRNNEGLLSKNERDEMEWLVEMGEKMSLIRAEALRLIQQRKGCGSE